MSSLFKYPGQTALVKIAPVKPTKPANRKKFLISFSLNKRRRVAEEAINDKREARREAEEARKGREREREGRRKNARSLLRERGRSKERRREKERENGERKR